MKNKIILKSAQDDVIAEVEIPLMTAMPEVLLQGNTGKAFLKTSNPQEYKEAFCYVLNALPEPLESEASLEDETDF
jgi:hypothetical protein